MAFDKYNFEDYLTGLAHSQVDFDDLARRCFEQSYLEEDWSDKKLPEDAKIEAAHPMGTGDHALYGEAMRLVAARRGKYELVDLVNWLLYELKEKV